MVTGFRVSQALSVAADLGLSDQLAGGPRTVADLARAVSADEDTLRRLLRALATVGVYAEQPRRLVRQHRAQRRATLRRAGEHSPAGQDTPGPGPLGSVGPSRTQRAYGRERVRGAARHGRLDAPGAAARAERDLQRQHGHPQPRGAGGGGSGVRLLRCRARSSTSAAGKGVAPGGRARPEPAPQPAPSSTWPTWWPRRRRPGHGVGRVAVAAAIRAASSRRSRAADAYLLKSILHDWPDAECVQILRTCRARINDGGVVLVVETGARPARVRGGRGVLGPQHARAARRPGAHRGGVRRPLRGCRTAADARSSDTATRYSIVEAVAAATDR